MATYYPYNAGCYLFIGRPCGAFFGARTVQTQTSEKPHKTNYMYKLYRVRSKVGKVTTVSLDPHLVIRAIRAIGSDKQVGDLVRAAAAEWDESNTEIRSRSRFVQRRLLDYVANTTGRDGAAQQAQAS